MQSYLRITVFAGTLSDRCGCPRGFRRCAGRCLRLLDRPSDFNSAVVACADLGAHLAVPRSQAENDCAWRMAQGGRKGRVLIGCNDITTEGVFVGVDGECGPVPASAAWWKHGEPNNFGGDEDCMMIFQGAWGDEKCSEVLFFPKYPLCQLSGCYQPHCE